MTEKELLSQLKNLKEIKPDESWKKQSRDILLSQISSHEIPAAVESDIYFLAHIKNFFRQPVAVVVVVLFFLAGGGFASVAASKNTKPGDSLYIAKKISEKAKLAIAFSSEKKAQLSIEFAGNRAKEIAQVIADDDTNESKAEKVGRLAEDFKKEIASAKTSLKKIAEVDSKQSPTENNNSEGAPEDSEIFSANLGRTEKGMQIYVQENKEEQSRDLSDSAAASSTKENIPEIPAANNANNLEKALGEAGEFLKNQDYGGTLNKLSEANDIVENINNKGEVKGISETATSTEGSVLGASEENIDNK